MARPLVGDSSDETAGFFLIEILIVVISDFFAKGTAEKAVFLLKGTCF